MSDYQIVSSYASAMSARKAKIDNNTYLVKNGDGACHVVLHGNTIATLQPDNALVLSSAGWRTTTTKDRLNQVLRAYGTDWRVAQTRGVWYLWHTQTKKEVPFADGITLLGSAYADGFEIDMSTVGSDSAANDARKVKARAKRYADAFIDALMNGEVAAPSGSDCWYCAMREADSNKPLGEMTGNDHIQSHMDENYFVPSLLARALEVMPSSIMMRDTAMFAMGADKAAIGARLGGERIVNMMRGDLSKRLRRYILRQMGVAA